MNKFTKLLASILLTSSVTMSLYATNESTQTGTNDMSQTQEQSAAFLKANSAQPGVVTLPNGLQYKILEAGTGPKPQPTSNVTVDYEGKLITGQVFDSSYARGKPISFALSQVIPGWQQGVAMMPMGSTWMLYIPADLAYGAAGIPGVIPPNSALVFKVHLISIQ